MNTIEMMLEAIKSLRHAYLNLLEAGHERILDLGGTCDPVDVMEDRDPYLAAAVKAIAAGEQELCREPVALEAERDALRADVESLKPSRLDRECLRIGQEIQRAAGELPDGWIIEIQVERGCGGVKLLNPEFDAEEFNDMVDGMSHCIRQAIDAAIGERHDLPVA